MFSSTWSGIVLTGLVTLGICSCGTSGYRGYMTKPYTIRGVRYHPMSVDEALYYKERGIASWYDESSFMGLKRGNTSLGERVMPWDVSGAHKTLPLPSRVRVTNLENGRSITLRLNDRGPFIAGRIIDLTPRAARKLGFEDQGLANVEVETISVGDGSYERKRPRRKRGIFSWLGL